MRLIYFGTGTFAIPSLRAMKDHVVLVVTQPDRPSGRGMKIQPSLVKQVAMDLGLPVESPEKARAPEFAERLESESADALLVASYGQILSQRVLDSGLHGGINLHGSILPKYRGAAPIQRCVLEGEQETGITLMQMDKGMDTGDIIEISRTPIGADETYGELQDRLAVIAAGMAVEWMPRIVAGEYPRTPQNSLEMTLASKIEKAEGEIDFRRDAGDEYNRFRAFTPAPGCFVRTSFGQIKLGHVRLGSGIDEPGTVLSTTEACEVALTGGSLKLLEVQPEGKKRMSGRDFANGMRLKPGMSLI